jgi:hypothetical protein
VDLTPVDRQIDPVVGSQGAVGLDDAAELERRSSGDRGVPSPVPLICYEPSAPVLMLPSFRPLAMVSTLAFWSAVSWES